MNRRDQLPLWDASALPEDDSGRSHWPPQHQRQLARCKPEMLLWLREHEHLTVVAVARKMSIPDERMEDWEHGVTQPTIPQLRKLAKIYKRPLAAFYLPAPPQGFALPHDRRRVADADESAYSTSYLVALRLASYRRAIALELDPDPPKAAFIDSADDETAEQLADRARQLLGLSLDEQFSWSGEYEPLNGWKNALEAMGVLVFHFTAVRVREVRGFSYAVTPYPVIAVNGHDSVNGRVFTLAHELGHLFLGEAATCDLGTFSAWAKESDPAEVFCNAFAGSLLVPSAALLGDAHLAEPTPNGEWDEEELGRLARRFGVSKEVILRRLLTLGKANPEFYERWRSDLLSLPSRGENEERREVRIPFARMVVRNVGKQFARMVVDAYRADRITGSDVADYLDARLKHLPKIEAQLTGPDVLTGGLP
jgi:Zn-dependent peptidase ImmA (M78 family)